MHEPMQIDEIEDELDRLQVAYLSEEDEVKQMELERKFSRTLQAATDLDGMDRLAAGITIHNWTRES